MTAVLVVVGVLLLLCLFTVAAGLAVRSGMEGDARERLRDPEGRP